MPQRQACVVAAWLVLCCGIAAGAAVPAAYSTAVFANNDEGPGFVVHVSLQDEQLPEYGPSFKELDVEVTPQTVARLHVKIQPTDVPARWEVPESIVDRPTWSRELFPLVGTSAGPSSNPSSDPSSVHKMGSLLYSVQQPFDSPGNPFSLKVIRTPTNQAIFNTEGHRFVFKEQYIELSTDVPADADLYGLGEVTLPTGLKLPRDGSIVTLYNRDMPSQVPRANLYGSHPFILQVNSDGSAHGVFFLNSNGMDVVLNQTSLTYKVIGGLVDLYFFLGPSPEAVIRQYHEVIGAPAMPPYWALGTHQGRWGYKDIAVLEDVVANYRKADIPLEGLWLDIEYMRNRFQTLTFDETRFPVAQMRAFVDKLHKDGMHWVPIHDAGIAKRDGYKAYEEGTRDNVWIKDMHGQTYVGQVWPGEAVYPDYLAAPNITSWLKAQLQYFYDQVPFDGLWLDMNEASNYCSGINCRPDATNARKTYWLTRATPQDYDITPLIRPRTTCQMQCEEEPADNRLAYPPYKIHNFFWDEAGNEQRDYPINRRVISPTAQHADGTREYDAHNLFGATMAMRSSPAATEMMGRRAFVILRSTFPGAGKWAGHWTGDNAANWQSFKDSIPSILASNMWGIAMVGADICGFLDAAAYTNKDMGDPPTSRLDDEEYRQLCNRWTSAGAFYPFARNHYTWDSRSHEPYRWPDVAAAARKAYGMRYRLLTYLYSSMHLAHTHGGTLARPLFFTDPTDKAARAVSSQWMMGDALLISPVLDHNRQEVAAYFTDGRWYSLWDYSRIEGPGVRTLQVPLGDIPLHIRGGTIVPMQQAGVRARDVRLSPITLVVALPGHASGGGIDVSLGPLSPHALDELCGAVHAKNVGSQVACGYLFMDSGEEVAITNSNSLQVWLAAVASASGSSGKITSSTKSSGGDACGKLRVEAIHILGVPQPAAGSQARVVINGGGVAFDAAAGALMISGLSLVVGEPLDVQWSI